MIFKKPRNFNGTRMRVPWYLIYHWTQKKRLGSFPFVTKEKQLQA